MKWNRHRSTQRCKISEGGGEWVRRDASSGERGLKPPTEEGNRAINEGEKKKKEKRPPFGAYNAE